MKGWAAVGALAAVAAGALVVLVPDAPEHVSGTGTTNASAASSSTFAAPQQRAETGSSGVEVGGSAPTTEGVGEQRNAAVAEPGSGRPAEGAAGGDDPIGDYTVAAYRLHKSQLLAVPVPAGPGLARVPSGQTIPVAATDPSGPAIAADGTSAAAGGTSAATGGASTAGSGTSAGSSAPAPSAPASSNVVTAFYFRNTIPPDSTAAVGPSDQLVATNERLKIYTKGGLLGPWELYGPYALADFLPSAALCGASYCSGVTAFDPVAMYDQQSGRFVVITLALRKSDKLSRVIVSVSDDSSANGNWCHWWTNGSKRAGTVFDEWSDYPKVGVTNNAIVVTTNQFSWAGAFTTARARVFWKSQIYGACSGSLTTYDIWSMAGNPFTLVPASSTINTSGVMHLLDTSTAIGSSSTKLSVRTLTIPNTVGSAATLSAPTNLTVATYTAPPSSLQKGTSTALDSGDARILTAQRTSAGIFAVQTTGCTLAGDAAVRSCIRYYQLTTGTTPTVSQQYTWGYPATYYSYPGLAANNLGSLVIPFQRSASTEFMSSRYTARKNTDAINTLQASSVLATGTACYVRVDGSGRNRMGDYNGAWWDASTGKFVIMAERSTGGSTCSANSWEATMATVDQP